MKVYFGHTNQTKKIYKNEATLALTLTFLLAFGFWPVLVTVAAAVVAVAVH